MFVSLADFTARPYRVPNQDESTDFIDFIGAAETELVKRLLGHTLYTAFIAGLGEDPVPQKWTDLKVGKAYEYADKQFMWVGMKNLLVPAIFSMWVEENRDKFTNTGTVFNVADKSEHVSPAHRIVRGWNTFAELVGGPNAHVNTLYGFIYATNKAAAETYADWVFEPPGFINEFGL